jgi:hypothetical protein
MLSCASAVSLPALFLFAFSQPVAQQSAGKPESSPSIPMPADRAAASYEIYAALIPSGETAGPRWPHDLFLVRDTTIAAVQPGKPCQSQPPNDDDMNPHIAVQPAPEDRHDFEEILQDFDKHCHEQLILHPWKSALPIRLLNEDEQKEFESTRGRRDSDPAIVRKYQGAAAIYGFSQVYFNAHSTVAMVYVTTWCGNLCGQGWWSGFALKDGRWRLLRWGSTSWIS